MHTLPAVSLGTDNSTSERSIYIQCDTFCPALYSDNNQSIADACVWLLSSHLQHGYMYVLEAHPLHGKCRDCRGTEFKSVFLCSFCWHKYQSPSVWLLDSSPCREHHTSMVHCCITSKLIKLSELEKHTTSTSFAWCNVAKYSLTPVFPHGNRSAVLGELWLLQFTSTSHNYYSA